MFRPPTLIALVVLAGCRPNPAPPLTETEQAEIAQTARQVVDSAFAAIVRVDPSGLMGWFASGAEPTFSADGMIVAGHDSIAAFFGAALATWRRVDSASLQNVRVAVLARDAAVVTANYRELVTDATGGQSWNAGAWTTTVARRNGEWRIVDSHASHPRAP